MAPCEVCSEGQAKYKCSACQLPYCSLSCYKTHKPVHADKAQATKSLDASKSPTNEVISPLSSQPAPPLLPADTFASLRTSKDLEQLFTRYPGLRSQLHHIYATSLQPVPDEDGDSLPKRGQFLRGRGKRNLRGRGSRRRAWNPDRGRQDGVRALKRAAVADGSDGRGVREFMELVAKICLPPDQMVDEVQQSQGNGVSI